MSIPILAKLARQVELARSDAVNTLSVWRHPFGIPEYDVDSPTVTAKIEALAAAVARLHVSAAAAELLQRLGANPEVRDALQRALANFDARDWT